MCQILQKHDQWGYYFGAVLAAIGLCLSGSLSTVLIGSGYSYDDLVPQGSHPLLDPLWSTGALRIVHDGAETTRMRKVEVIARETAALRMLRVCGEQPESEMNCGRKVPANDGCSSVARPARSKLPTFPHRIDLKHIRRLDLTGFGYGPYWREFLRYPMDPSLRRTIGSVVRAGRWVSVEIIGTWKSKARRVLALAKHMRTDLAAGLRTTWC